MKSVGLRDGRNKKRKLQRYSAFTIVLNSCGHKHHLRNIYSNERHILSIFNDNLQRCTFIADTGTTRSIIVIRVNDDVARPCYVLCNEELMML